MKRTLWPYLALLAVVVSGAIFYLNMGSAVTANYVAGKLAGTREEVNENLELQGAPYVWDVTSMPHKDGDTVRFTSQLTTTMLGQYPDIPLVHQVTGTKASAVVVTTTGNFPGKDVWKKGTSGREPIEVTLNVGAGDTTGTVMMPGARIEHDDVVFGYDEVRGTLRIGSESYFKTEPFRAMMDFPGEAGRQQLSLVVLPSESSWDRVGTITASGGLKDVAGTRSGEAIFQLGEVTFHTSQRVDRRDALSSILEMTLRDVVFDSGTVELPMVVLKADAGPFPMKAMKALQDIQASEEPEAMAQQAQAALEHFDRPINLGFSLSSDQGGGAFTGVRATIPPLDNLTLNDPAAIQTLFDRIEITAEMRASADVLPAEAIPQLEQLVLGGWAVKKDGQFVIEANYSNGQLDYLGQVYTAQELMMLFMQMAAKEGAQPQPTPGLQRF